MAHRPRKKAVLYSTPKIGTYPDALLARREALRMIRDGLVIVRDGLITILTGLWRLLRHL